MARSRPLAALLALVLLPACNGGAGPDGAPTAPAGASATADGVRFTADTRVMESFPVQLATTVTMTNESSSRRTVELGSGCPVLLRAYRDAARTRLAWDQGRGRACTMQIQIVELAPGQSGERSTDADGYEILGDSLPDGRYWLEVFVQRLPEPLTLSAGAVDLAVPR